MNIFKVDDKTIFIVDRFKIEIDEENSNKLLNYYRTLPDYVGDDYESLFIEGIDCSSGLKIDLEFNDYIITIGDETIIFPDFDREYVISALEDSSPANDIEF